MLIASAEMPDGISFGAADDEALAKAIEALPTGLSFCVNARRLLSVVKTLILNSDLRA